MAITLEHYKIMELLNGIINSDKKDRKSNSKNLCVVAEFQL